MTLLRRIQDAAVDSKTNITDVLRQCAILAARLGHEGFKKWVDEELNGYLSGVEVPPYRIMTGLQSTGHFVGPFGEQISNVPLPLGNIPEQLRPRVASMEFRQGSVHSRQWWKATPEDLISPWPADLIERVRDRFIQGRSLMAATISMPRSEIVGLLEAPARPG